MPSRSARAQRRYTALQENSNSRFISYQISTPPLITVHLHPQFFFTSFSAREKSYQGVFRMWQNTLLDKVRPCSTYLLQPDTDQSPNCTLSSVQSSYFIWEWPLFMQIPTDISHVSLLLSNTSTAVTKCLPRTPAGLTLPHFAALI